MKHVTVYRPEIDVWGFHATKDRNKALLEAAENVLWKLSHNHDTERYKGPATITRKDATVRELQRVVDVIREEI